MGGVVGQAAVPSVGSKKGVMVEGKGCYGVNWLDDCLLDEAAQLVGCLSSASRTRGGG